jgi:hypothetical protein
MNTKRWLMTASLMAPGCGATFEQLQARAALDLECHPAAISAHSVDGQTRVASGCDKQAIYVETCSGHNHSDCTWMLNSAGRGRAKRRKSRRVDRRDNLFRPLTALLDLPKMPVFTATPPASRVRRGRSSR